MEGEVRQCKPGQTVKKSGPDLRSSLGRDEVWNPSVQQARRWRTEAKCRPLRGSGCTRGRTSTLAVDQGTVDSAIEDETSSLSCHCVSITT